ncbi:NAD-dependent epimerase [bacterium]|nr:NAD-dependent epimerase [bacterium]
MTILITGGAGFIGYHLASKILEAGNKVVVADNLNSYYDPELKKRRLEELRKCASKFNSPFYFFQINIDNFDSLSEIFAIHNPTHVVNLAAQAGVRYSIENPSAYIQANLVGFANVLECCRQFNIKNLIFASSSSVYGGNENLPFSEQQGVDHPVSLYAASKKSNELMAHSYSHLYGLSVTGLRFFTVYGPWGRPDMALFLFTKAIIEGNLINIFNNGQMSRDFTYIDDVVESILRLLHKPASPNISFDKKKPDPSTSWAPYRIFNIGNSEPVPLMNYIQAIEKALNIKAKMNFMPMQPGDVENTASDTSALEKWIKFKPNTSIDIGVTKFIEWYRNFYQV